MEQYAAGEVMRRPLSQERSEILRENAGHRRLCMATARRSALMKPLRPPGNNVGKALVGPARWLRHVSRWGAPLQWKQVVVRSARLS